MATEATRALSRERPGAEPALRVRELTKSFHRGPPWHRRAVEILRGASLEVGRGELVGLVGENGSGKSVLMQIVVGLLPRDGGTVDAPARLGYCPQVPMLWDKLTVAEHFQLFSEAYRLLAADPARSRDALLDELSSAKYLDYRVEELSGGTRQKLNLALALLHQPDLLLLDEPYAGFDWETYLRFWEMAERRRSEGMGVLVVSHLLSERERLTRVYELRNGRCEVIRQRSLCASSSGRRSTCITIAFLAGLVGVFVMQSARQADRRLVVAGFRPYQALAPRLLVLAATTTLVLAVSLAVTALSFAPSLWAPFVVGNLLVGLIYAMLGALAGAVVGKLGARYLLLFGAMLDLGVVQNPMFGSGEPPAWGIALPGYGSARVIIDAHSPHSSTPGRNSLSPLPGSSHWPSRCLLCSDASSRSTTSEATELPPTRRRGKARGIDPWDLRSSCRGGELPRPGVESPNVDRHAGLHELDDKTAHMEPDVR